LAGIHSPAAAGDIDFNRDVRPILSRHCFKCHGPDEKARKSKLRLDVRAAAIGEAKSGERAIVPGKPDESELVRRIFEEEATEVMPPPAVKNPLSAAQKQLLRGWIAAGAEYQPHWAFVPPRRPALPRVHQSDWPRNPIDQFVLARMEAAGLAPSPPADRYVLVRRVYLDLIGLPPTPEEADASVNDRSPAAYERLVDRLLASPHYGERWARRWLDLARYADTNGYEKDRARSIWPYRDWVIRALNCDLGYDQFTVEQVAGDLLPHATVEQKVATGFHRNTMLNEEGGIDPLEFRFHAMTDRVATTGTTWLGLTIGCAQCHTHKFDPITQPEYYQFMAFLNNADEPLMDVPLPELATRRAELNRQIEARLNNLASRFPPEEGEMRWHTPRSESVVAASGAAAQVLPDRSVRLSGKNATHDTYTVQFQSNLTEVTALRLEALTDPALPSTGPGRTPHGNFVLSEVRVTVLPRGASGQPSAVKLAGAEADFAQNGFPAAHAIDGNPKTGWAIHGPGKWNVNRTITFTFQQSVRAPKGAQWSVWLDQQHGTGHTLGRFRLSLGERRPDARSLEVRRKGHLERKFEEWRKREAARAVRWTIVRPIRATANVPRLSVQGDGSILADGDQSKRDAYNVTFRTDLRGVRALRLEVLPDARLPRRGPGRVYYEGSPGDFFLSELTVTAGGRPVRLVRATQSFAAGASTAAAAIDGKPETGWSIAGGEGRAHAAVFNFAEPLTGGQELALNMVFERYYASALGRFRVSVTADTRPAEASGLPASIGDLLLVPAQRLSGRQRKELLHYYLLVAPELARERAIVEQLRSQRPAYPTTLVMAERPADNPRPTFIHRRGEFLQPTERVRPDVPASLPPLPSEAPRNRLAFTRWLVDAKNPLTARVAMNRQWAVFFGRGIVRTEGDFGYQGEPPTHPELLDWLAVEFVRQGWSMKAMHRLMVTSATYQQSSRVSAAAKDRDPANLFLTRGPRARLEAELIRDAVLRSSGLLAGKIGGPSVFPPQPPGVTSEGTYGALPWNVSQGLDRYRRGLYTFSKRTAPYAMFTTFDAPSGEACVARREVSNTPLQALTLLNDPVFVEAAQALGRMAVAQPGSAETHAALLFRRCLTRPPRAAELTLLTRFYRVQKQRFLNKELDAALVAGPGDNLAERAAWTTVARALLNLDETITKD
jgi:hypothetical protein